MTDNITSREIVLDMLIEIIEKNKFSHTVVNHTLKKHQNLEKQERAFINRLTMGTVKSYITLDYIIDQFASLPVFKMKPLIRNLLRLSVYQIFYMDQVPISAVCNEAVKLAKKRGFTQLSGFVNGVLRNIARNKDIIRFPDRESRPINYLEITYSTPKWLVKELLNQYPFDVVEKILSASLKEKETSIRCNQLKTTPLELKEELSSQGLIVRASEYLDYAFIISNFDYLDNLEAFNEGKFTVQDVSSMLVGEVAGIEADDFVVDVCAAPGGKSLHAAEKAGKVSARDLTEYKINLIENNIKRMAIGNIETKCWDATELDESLINQADIVIADLPCSGLGIIGKKADIKYKISKKQLEELAELQRRILNVVMQYVKVGGVLLYSTCTINQRENLDNRDWILEQGNFTAEDIDPYLPKQLQSNETKSGYLQLLQGVHNTDGFFISKFRRIK